jgi:hypothetical protein
MDAGIISDEWWAGGDIYLRGIAQACPMLVFVCGMRFSLVKYLTRLHLY